MADLIVLDRPQSSSVPSSGAIRRHRARGRYLSHVCWPSVRRGIWVLGVAAITSCQFHQPNTNSSEASSAQVITLADFIADLPKDHIAVGFDVDDTALFSSPAFMYAKGRLLPDVPKEQDSKEETQEAWLAWVRDLEPKRDELFTLLVSSQPSKLSVTQREQWRSFWNDVNTAGGAFSPPKAVARQLMREHLRRGDSVVFITARPNAGMETLTEKLRQEFASDSLLLVFTGLRPKDEILRLHRIAIYYGDSDGDIEDAVKAGARAVRIVRSSCSTNTVGTNPGRVGEWRVIADSDL